MRVKFELTNQESVGGKTVNEKGIEVGQLLLQEMALNIHEKGFRIPKTICVTKLLIYNLAPKMSRQRPTTRS